MALFIPKDKQEFSTQDGSLKIGRLHPSQFFFNDSTMKNFGELSSQLKSIKGIAIFYLDNLTHSIRLESSVIKDPQAISEIMIDIQNTLSSEMISSSIIATIKKLTGFSILTNDNPKEIEHRGP